MQTSLHETEYAATPITGLARHFLDRGLLTRAGLREAQLFQANYGGALHAAALRLGLAREQDLLTALADFLQLTSLTQSGLAEPMPRDIHSALSHLQLTPEWLTIHDAIIWFSGDAQGAHNVLYILARDPLNTALAEELERRWQGARHWLLAPNRTLDGLLASIRPGETDTDTQDGEDGQIARMRELAEEAPVIDFVNGLFSDALELDASDIHVEPGPDGFETKFRVDGVLSNARFNALSLFDPVCTRIKILSGMDISERRLPQDGRQAIRISGEEIDLRVSTLPATHGESIVMRVLRKKSNLPDIEGLGLRGAALDSFRAIIGNPNGVVLVTGPTGSGKSTTLYRALELLNDGKRKIITIEDPVEYEISGINQVQAHAEIGLTFASGLRSMLRQDPDVIMVGEIRDQETALIAIQAALTGHLVFSTLHTNSAVGSLERLQDLGVEPFLMDASLRGMMGQRLLRRLCPHCSQLHIEPEQHQALLAMLERNRSAVLPDLGQSFARARGCDHCGGTGYKGRIGVYEIINFAAYAKARDTAIEAGRTVSETELLHNIHFVSMLEDGICKASHGETSLEEVERVFGNWHGNV